MFGGELLEVVQVAEKCAGLAGATREQAAAIAGNVQRWAGEACNTCAPYLGSTTAIRLPALTTTAENGGEYSTVIPFDGLHEGGHVEDNDDVLDPMISMEESSTDEDESIRFEAERDSEKARGWTRPGVPTLRSLREELPHLTSHNLTTELMRTQMAPCHPSQRAEGWLHVAKNRPHELSGLSQCRELTRPFQLGANGVMSTVVTLENTIAADATVSGARQKKATSNGDDDSTWVIRHMERIYAQQQQHWQGTWERLAKRAGQLHAQEIHNKQMCSTELRVHEQAVTKEAKVQTTRQETHVAEEDGAEGRNISKHPAARNELLLGTPQVGSNSCAHPDGPIAVPGPAKASPQAMLWATTLRPH